MLGNDVIDLADPETWPGACHPRFESRVFTSGERAAIAASPRPACTRWVHWAAKESAYKAARRRAATTVFAPRRFVVQLAAAGAGDVRHGSDRFRLRVSLGRDVVHAIAWDEDATGVLVADVARLDGGAAPAELSAAARALAVRTIGGALGVPAVRLAVVRLAGTPPRLLRDGRPAHATLSLSHHGQLVAFACLLSSIGDA